MLVLLALIAFSIVVGLLAWRTPKRVQLRSCCSARPWPPTDLMDEPAEAPHAPQRR